MDQKKLRIWILFTQYYLSVVAIKYFLASLFHTVVLFKIDAYSKSKNESTEIAQLTFARSKSTIETVEKGVKYVQS